MQLTTWSTASEEGPTPEVINTTSTANSCCNYWGTTNILEGQKLIFHSNRNYSNTHHHITSQHNSPHTARNTPNTGNNLANPITTQSPNNSNITECLQSQILGLQTQALQQSILNLIKSVDSNNKSKFTLWVQSVENAAELYNLDIPTIMLSKLQGPPLKSAHFLESKEISSGKQLNWHSLKKHLTTNYSEIPYDTHTINAYDNLHQGSDESTSAYLHRAHDILECIHNTSNMTSIPAINTNHAKILTGLRDSRLCNKLAKSKAKKWTTCPRFYRMLQIWLLTSNGHVDTHSQHLKFNMFHLQILVLLTGPTSWLQEYTTTINPTGKTQMLAVRENTTKRTVQQPQANFPPKIQIHQGKAV